MSNEPVTGANITDEMIRDLVRGTTSPEVRAIGASALNPLCHEPRRSRARDLCAGIINFGRGVAAADDLTPDRIETVYQMALSRGDRRLLGDVNMARQGEREALERVADAWRRRNERP